MTRCITRYAYLYGGAKKTFRDDHRLFQYLGRSAEIQLPVDFGVGAKPGELTLGVVPGFELEVGDGLLFRGPAGEVVEGLLVPEGGEGFGAGGIQGEKMAGFFDETVVPHVGRALVNGAI